MSSVQYFKVVVEISANSLPVKYEIDTENNKLCVDRFLSTSMQYPCNYGFIDNTLGHDRDALDALVITPHPVQPMASIMCRAIGVLKMQDEKGEDEKILALPASDITTMYDHIQKLSDVPALLLKQIEHFFVSYKQNDKKKWAKVAGWADEKEASAVIKECTK